METLTKTEESAPAPALEELVEIVGAVEEAPKKKAKKVKKAATPPKEEKKEKKQKKVKASRLVKSAGQTPATIYNRLSHFPDTGRRAQLFKLLKLTPTLVTVAGVTYPGPFQVQTPKVQAKLAEFLASPTEANRMFYND